MLAARGFALAFTLTLASCGGAGKRTVWPGATCLTRLSSAPLPPGDPPELAVPLSRVVVDLQLHTGSLLAELEKSVPRRVVERRGQDIGAAGKLSFVVDRGPFAVAVRGDELSVDVDLRGHAELCKPLSFLGCVDYASCSPAAHAHAAMTLLLDPSFHLPPSHVAIPLTRRCTLTALSIDVTGEVEAQASARAVEIRKRIDESIPDAQPLVREVWEALGQSVPIGLGTCARVYPTELVQSGPRVEGDTLSLALGAEGEVRVESPCAPGRPSPPLPPPRVDREARPGVHLAMPMVVSWDEVGRAMARSLALSEIAAGTHVLHVTDARALPTSDGAVQLTVVLAGDVCGEVAFVGRPTFDERASWFVLRDMSPAPGETERVQALAPGLALGDLARRLAADVHAGAPLELSTVARRIDRAAAMLLAATTSGGGPHTPEIDVRMTSSSAGATSASREGLSVVILAEGAATVRVR